MTGPELVALVERSIRVQRVRGLRPQDYDDLVQSAALTAVRAVRAFDPSLGASMQTHVRRRVDGAVIDWLRSFTGYGKYGLHAKQVFVEYADEAPTEIDALSVLVQKDAQERIFDRVRKLPRKQRFVTRARIRGISGREIASRLRVSLDGVWYLVGQARETLHAQTS